VKLNNPEYFRHGTLFLSRLLTHLIAWKKIIELTNLHDRAVINESAQEDFIFQQVAEKPWRWL